MTNFVQIDPNDWKPGPYWVIAVIAADPIELDRTCHIKFREIQEDLGPLDIAFVETPDGFRYILRRYRNNPGPGTEIWGIEDVPDISQSVKSLLGFIGLDDATLLWVADK